MEEAIIISPLDEKMEQDLVKSNVTDAAISALRSKYGALKLRSVDDKETYLEIKEAKKDCAKLRNLAVKVCKAGRDEANKVSKKWVAKEKEVVEKIEEVENPLDAEIDRFDAEVKRKELEEKQRQETQYMQRTQALTKMGAMYSDNSFVLGDFSLEANLVKESSQEVWDEEILPKFNEQFFVLEAERIEQEKVKAEKEAELKRQQEYLEQRESEFRRQREEFEKQKAEEERKKREEQGELQQYRYMNMIRFASYGEKVDLSNLWSLSQDDFDEILARKRVAYQEYEANLQKQIAEAAAQKERERIAEEQRQAEAKRQAEEQRRAEELAKAGDKAIWADFINKISAIQPPTVKSRQYKQMLNIAKEKIEEINALKPQ